MPGRPSFQFYPGDWKKNQKLRFCSWAARGVWIEVLGLMHDSDEYGILRQPLKGIAQALGAPMKLLNELVEQGVLYGCAQGKCAPMVYRPKHGRVEGAPVVLVAEQDGPIWYSPRMVRDEYVRLQRGSDTRFNGQKDSPKGTFGDDSTPSPKVVFGEWSGEGNSSPNHAPSQRQGDGSSSSSSSSSSNTYITPSAEISVGADEQARAVVDACKALRKLGMFDVQPQRPELFDLANRGFTVAQMALTASELALKAANFLNDSDMHPELLELFASGATQEQMLLTFEQYTHLRNCAPKLPYLAATLIGRVADAARNAGQRAARDNQSSKRPSAADSFKGKTYAGTAIEQLPAEFRDAVSAVER